MVAVSVILAPYVGLAEEDTTGVMVTVAWALLTAASRNSSRKAAQPRPFRTREVIAKIPFRVVVAGMDRVSNI
jgi:hypothetical protein